METDNKPLNKDDITIGFIIKVCCGYFRIPIDKIHAKTRKREIVQVRQIAMYFSKLFTRSSLASIGAQIGNKDHATVLHACKTVKNLSDTNKQFRYDVEEIEKRLIPVTPQKSIKDYLMELQREARKNRIIRPKFYLR